MKSITALLVALAMILVLTPQSAMAQATPLPANVQSELQAALQSVNPTDSVAVRKAVKDAIAKNPSLAPEIVAYFVKTIGQALSGNPNAAASVIPAFVLDATSDYPKLQNQILISAISAVPTGLKIPVVPLIAGAVIDGQDDPRAKAELLNAVYEAIGDNDEIISELDTVATKNKIEIADNDGDPTTDRTTRYFVNDPATIVGLGGFSGDQGAINNGGGGGFGGSSGGSGNTGDNGNNGSGPTPTPTPTPAPTPVS
jgi:hypothetical protein